MTHNATFTWPPTASERVVVTGTFDNWSGTAHPLHRDPQTGYFATTVPIPYGEKVAYKYVVDGQWMTREDEAKEWGESDERAERRAERDSAAGYESRGFSRGPPENAAGNMNNVYTAPHAPAPSEPGQSADRTAVPSSTSAVPDPATEQTQAPSAATGTETASEQIAGLAAGAASAIGIKKAQSHPTAQDERTTPTGAQGTGNERSFANADKAVTGSTTGGEPAASQPSTTTTTKADSLVASQLPAASSTSSKHIDNDNVPAAHHTTTTTDSSLAGLSLGAPIGGTTESYAAPAWDEKRNIPTPASVPGDKEQHAHASTTTTEKSEETAVAPKSAGPPTAIPQPAVIVPGSAGATTIGSLHDKTDKTTAVAPKDVGPATAIPHPAVSGEAVPAPSTAATNIPSSAAIKTGGVDLPTTTTSSTLNDVNGGNTLAERAETVVHSAQETATQVGTSALAVLSAAASGLVIGVGDAVHAVTGVDIVHRDPTGFPLPAPPPPAMAAESSTYPSSAAAGGGARPLAHRGPSSSSGSLYKLGDQELRRRSWNLHNNDIHHASSSSPTSSSSPLQISVEEANRAGIDHPASELPSLGTGQPSTTTAAALANTMTASVPVVKDTAAAQVGSTARGVASGFTNGQVASATTVTPAVREKSTDVQHANNINKAPVTSYTDIPLPPAQDGLPAPKDDADIQAARSVPQSSITPTGLHPTAPRVSAPVHGSMAGSAGPTSGSAVNQANKNAATASSPSAPKQPDVFSSNKHDKPAIPAGDKKAEYKTDLPAQHETKSTNHKSVPMPLITSIGDNTKDRTQPSLADNADKEVSSNPAEDPHKAKAEAHAGLMNNNNEIDGVPSRSYVKKPEAVAGLPLETTQKPVSELPAVPAAASPGTPVKPVCTAAAPQTPVSKLAASEVQASPASTTGTATSTPGAKDVDGKKKKGSFISKMKSVFHKDKAAK
ncbi:hypothetical protein QFC19_004051 [Naganishia cerealis]|uniref:Uncharacterized protein n=1 Tax=Naganishia cerealis TaxID=610337 RepID=A0ACC2VZ30_9TREE|nr:hypothetical protein QFC19_004051 [Naganishia cerealis]